MQNRRRSPLTRSGHLRLRPGDFESVDFLTDEGVLNLTEIVTAIDLIPHMAITWFDYAAVGPNGLGWRSDGCYYFAGDLRRHEHFYLRLGAKMAKPLHLFTRHWGGRAQVTRYIDEFVIEDIIEQGGAAQSNGQPQNQPIYKLRPVEAVAHVPGQIEQSCADGVVAFKPIERSDLLDTQVVTGLRDENLLVLQFCRHLRKLNHSVQRLQIRHTVGHAPLFTDIWVDTAFLLVEAKVKPDRDSVREAIGQMADYTRFLPNPRRAILLSGRPEGDLIELAHSERCALIWPSTSRRTWFTSAPWLTDLLVLPDGELGDWMKRFPSALEPGYATGWR